LTVSGFLIQKKRFVEPLLLLGTAYASLTSVRHSTIFVVLAAPVVAAELSAYWRAWVDRQPHNSAGRVLDQLSIEKRTAFDRSSLWAAAGLAAIFAWTPAGLWPTGFDHKLFPVELAARHPELATARVFASDQWADYLLYKNYPQQKVFYDDRNFYGAKMYQAVSGLMNGARGWAATLDQYQTTQVLTPAGSALSDRLRESPQWKLVDRDGTAELFARR
jgi:hypothetical protein